jgi:iron complex transport system substrate-binding protein
MNVSFEYIVEKDPDYLFVVDRNAVVGGDAAAKETIENELVQRTKAYQNGKIIP